ncbi:DEAD/DEAH box helicase [Phaeobacter sp. HS012]|uniref:Superfamily II DNA and RNA helicase n=1 Tax=Phaeobacter inhibens TaxID=221822 RepID=A0A2I7K735_9RHOB|nr:Superfamily II DNA and RNA helicase [Phaeobacter inhibens]MBQ4806320.1 DEAD/DEAH box helicase [Phaeobacter sp. HS012]MBQ4881170.1 DEAD/DEAH box helicase [Phaeobacter sp. HS011]UWR53945.1 DEAD/DEAH box helicase [Phaeobacter inhibens]UWR77325.1 DEAD/DEAH box helicase [Phaeobacter inhibens]
MPSGGAPRSKRNEILKTALEQALQARGYEHLTPVQEAVTAAELDQSDLLVSAQTGSGKTVGFGLAMAPTLLGDAEKLDRADLPLALVIAPTRELALQVKRELGWLYAEAGAHVVSTVGGMDMRDERRALERGAHIVVATPGRLRDHIMRGSINLSQVRAVVLDEADEMLDLGFREDLEFILGESPEDRRTLMFSATVPTGIARLAETYLKDHQRIKTVAEASQHADIEYQMLAVAQRDVENAVINVLRFHESPNAIVFCNTRAVVNRMTTRLSNRGFSVVALSGELSQAERSNALQSLRDGRARVCVATDVAARGIDLPKLDLVIHADLPSSHETLLHRSGRTGRAGRQGVSALIVPPKAKGKALRLLRSAKITAETSPAPSADDVRTRDFERLLGDKAWSEPVSENETAPVAELVERFSPEQLAVAYLRLFHDRHSAPEELSDPQHDKREREERAPFGPSVWFAVSGGRKAGAEPRRLLPALCNAGGLTKDDIGAIRVQFDQSYVEVRESSAESFWGAVKHDGLEEGANVTRLDKAPDLPKSPRPQGRDGGGFRDDKRGHRGQDRGDRGGERGERKPYGDKPRSDKPRGDKPSYSDKPRGEKSYGDKPRASKPYGDKPRGDKPAYGDKPRFDKPKRTGEGGKATVTARGSSDRGATPSAPAKPAVPGKPKGDWSNPGKSGRKGPPPPKGKPNSKKNKARAVVSGKPGGSARPQRKGS